MNLQSTFQIINTSNELQAALSHVSGQRSVAVTWTKRRENAQNARFFCLFLCAKEKKEREIENVKKKNRKK